MKYIEVKLTEDQANHILWMLNQDNAYIVDNSTTKLSQDKPLAFNKRLFTAIKRELVTIAK